MPIDRRRLFAWTALIGLGAAAAARVRAQPKPLDPKDIKKDAEFATAYHCDFGAPERFGQMLNNVNNHLSVYDFDPFKAKIVIVAHAAGVKFFLKDLAGTPWDKETLAPELEQRMAALAKYGVEVLICRLTFQRLKLDIAKIRADGYIKLVPSGVATVAELQGKGFAYLKIG